MVTECGVVAPVASIETLRARFSIPAVGEAEPEPTFGDLHLETTVRHCPDPFLEVGDHVFRLFITGIAAALREMEMHLFAQRHRDSGKLRFDEDDRETHGWPDLDGRADAALDSSKVVAGIDFSTLGFELVSELVDPCPHFLRDVTESLWVRDARVCLR